MKRFGTNQAAKELAAVHIENKKETAKVEPTQSTRVHSSVMQKVELIRLYSKTGMLDIEFTSQIEFISRHMDAICDKILAQVKK